MFWLNFALKPIGTITSIVIFILMIFTVITHLHLLKKALVHNCPIQKLALLLQCDWSHWIWLDQVWPNCSQFLAYKPSESLVKLWFSINIYSPLLSFLVYESVTKGMKTKVHRWSRPVLFVVVMFDGFIIFFIHFGAKSSITIWSMIHYRIRSFGYTRNQEFCDSNCDNCLISISKGYKLSSQVKKSNEFPMIDIFCYC